MLNIGGIISIGGDSPCRFVAELSNNHNGDFDRAIRLIDAAKAAGADFVKFQCYTPDELVALRGDGPAPEPWGSQGWTMRTLYEKAQTPFDWFPRLVQHCESIGMPWFSSVFGAESLALLESLGCPAYKIARLDSHDSELRRTIQDTGKPIVISADRWSDVAGFASGRVTLFCPPGYPPTTIDLPVFDALSWRHEIVESEWTGLSSHCLDARLPVAAVARGCKLIEAHLQLDHAFADRTPSCATYRGFSCDCNNLSELEANVSLTASQFKQMVADVRATEAMLA